MSCDRPDHPDVGSGQCTYCLKEMFDGPSVDLHDYEEEIRPILKRVSWT